MGTRLCVQYYAQHFQGLHIPNFLFFLFFFGGGHDAIVVYMLDFRSEHQQIKAQSLPMCCFLGQETLLHIFSLHPCV